MEKFHYSSYTIFVPGQEDVAYAHQVSTWTQEAKTMLPKSPEEMVGLFAQGLSVLVEWEGKVASHAAVTFAWPDGWKEVGAVVTDEAFRGKGLATIAVKAVMDLASRTYPNSRYFALCNSYSLPLFTKLGGIPMNGLDLPIEVWGACSTCPNFLSARNAGKTCCDTPVLIPHSCYSTR